MSENICLDQTNESLAVPESKKDILYDITFVLDRSGSMSLIKADMEGGFNQFIKANSIFKNAVVSLFQFDTQYEPIFEGIPIKDVGSLELVPRWGTALLDAVGRAIYATEQRFAKLSIKPDKILFGVITDGQENSSKEFTRQKIKELVATKETEGWSFTFLGANLDAFAEGGSLGFATNATQQYKADSGGTQLMWQNLTGASKTYACSNPGKKFSYSNNATNTNGI